MKKSARKFYLFLLPAFILLLHMPFVSANVKSENIELSKDTLLIADNTLNINTYAQLYESVNLDDAGLSRQAFDNAIKGYLFLNSQVKLAQEDTISIVDISLPSSKKRLFVLDLKNGKVLYNTYVAHGRNSGKEYANFFSNDPESFKSSLGFYVTKGTYNGQHGFSLRLEGEEKGINDNAFKRAIVMHSADYVDKKLINSQGYIGRSLGCPALPKEVYKPIIEKIKNGSCLFIYGKSSDYMAKSRLLQLASAQLPSFSSGDSLL